MVITVEEIRRLANDNPTMLGATFLSISEQLDIDAGLEPVLREFAANAHGYTASMAKAALFTLLYRVGRFGEAVRMAERELARLRLLSYKLRRANAGRSRFNNRFNKVDFEIEWQRNACEETLLMMLDKIDMCWRESDPLARLVEKAMAFSHHAWVEFYAIRLIQMSGFATPKMRQWLDQMWHGTKSHFVSLSDIGAAWNSIARNQEQGNVNAD